MPCDHRLLTAPLTADQGNALDRLLELPISTLAVSPMRRQYIAICNGDVREAGRYADRERLRGRRGQTLRVVFANAVRKPCLHRPSGAR
jgi:hypothetical protein